MEYCTTDDLVKVHANLTNLLADAAVTDFSDFISLAVTDFEDNLDMKWYRAAIIEHYPSADTYSPEANNFLYFDVEDNTAYGRIPFDTTRMTLSNPMKKCVIYLSISKIFESLSLHVQLKDATMTDKTRELSLFYKKKYDDAFEYLLSYGITYDFDGDGVISPKDYKYRSGKSKQLRLVRG